MESKEKLVSVVIPAYNAEAFIENCINSILRQSYQTFEIVVVNDGSKDNTLEILNRLAKADSRVKVYSKKNGGVSAARNNALSLATGDYITCVDADDDLPDDALKNMVSLMKDDVDFVVCSHNQIRFKTAAHIETPAVIKPEELNDKFMLFDKTIWWPWGKLFRRSIISENNLAYDPDVTFGEDHLFNLLYAKHITGKVVISDIIAYNYYLIRGGLCSKYYPDMNKIQKRVDEGITNFFGGIDYTPKEYIHYYSAYHFMGCVEYYITWGSKNEAIKRINETIDIYGDWLDDTALSEFFSDKQIEYIRKRNIDKFVFDYSLNHPRKTIIRKYLHKVKVLIEKMQKLKK